MALSKALRALSLKFAVVAGADADTDITVTGIAANDELIAVQESAQTTAAPTDRTATSEITDANDVQSSVAFTNTTSDKAIVIYHDSDGQAIASPCLKFILTTGAAAANDIAAVGIALEDTLLFVAEISVTDAIWTDRTAEASITAADVIQLSTTSTATDQILICYHDASGQGIDSICPVWGQCNGHATAATLSGIEIGDTLLMVLELATGSNIATLRTATSSITADDTIDNSVSTENDILLVLYHDASA